MSRLLRAIVGVILLVVILAPSTAGAATCQYVLGFATFHGLIPTIVGDCLVDEHHNADNGDGLQETTGGLLVWRKADNWTAFTDGYRTWVNGPVGLQERLNTQRFPWEADAASFPAAPEGPLPPAPAPISSSGVTFSAIAGARPGQNASVTVQTTPGVNCSIDYVTPLGTDSVAQGLVAKTADGNGLVSWTWLIGGNTRPGTGAVTVTCNGLSVSQPIQIG
jgi:hypothetical protein